MSIDLDMEEKLRRAAQKWRTMFDSIGDLICLLDTEKRVMQCNRATAKYLNLPFDKIIGKMCCELFHHTTEPIKDCPYLRMKGTLKRESLDCAMGNQWYNIQTDPIVDDSGNLTGAVHVLKDISERMLAEEALKQSESLYKALIETTNTGYVVIDGDGKVLDANHEYVRLSGHNALSEIRGRSVIEWTASYEKQKNEVAVRKCAKDGYIKNFEIDYIDRSGLITPVEINATVISTERLPCILTLVRDITERKKIEDALRFRNLILSTQQEVSIDGILVVDEMGRIISYNKRFVEMCSIPPEVIQSKSDEKALQAALDQLADPGEFIGRVKYLYANRMETSREEIKLKDGRTFDRYGAPMNSADGKYYGRVWFFRDITENKLAEDKLRESEERYRTLFDDAKDGIALADAETGQMVECNQALCIMVEREKTEIMGQNQSFLHPQQPLTNGHSATFVRHKSGDPGLVVEDQLISKSGKLIPVEIRAARIQMNGRNYLLGIFRDICTRKLLEKEKEHLQAQLLQAQKLEVVGTLAGGVAHDFNNFLTAISGYINLATMKIDDSDPIYRDLKQAGIAAGRASKVVRQLLLFSRKQPMEPSSLNLNETVNNLLKMLKRLIGEDFQIETDLAPDLWVIQGDEGNIEQVIMNLVVNARDAMPQSGRITIRTENVHIDDEYCRSKSDARPGLFILLSITDTGTGMDADILGHIFEPFFTTKEKGKGTGLGLSVVYGIVKQHDGWIVVDSKLGQGTTFKIYLPSSQVKIARKTSGEGRIEKYKGKGERVLVVEDEEAVREVAMEVLKNNGYSVFQAENAKKARELFAQEKGDFDLVFSDLVLPDESGIQLVEELSHGSSLHTLFTSGYIDDKSGFNIIKEKNYNFLSKPYTMESLLKAVREAVG